MIHTHAHTYTQRHMHMHAYMHTDNPHTQGTQGTHVHACTHRYTHKYIHTCTQARMHIHTDTYAQSCIHAHRYTHAQVHKLHMCTGTPAHTYMYIGTKHTHAHMYTHIHTHIHTEIWKRKPKPRTAAEWPAPLSTLELKLQHRGLLREPGSGCGPPCLAD